MITVALFSLISVVSGAAIERRDAVPAGYYAPPYYPGIQL